MVYTTCSINKVFAQIYRDFKPSYSGWVEDAVEWIGDAIDIMRCGGNYTTIKKTVEVIDFRAKLPCDIKSLMGVAYNGYRLPRNGGIASNLLTSSDFNTLPESISESYVLNPNRIDTSFQTGCVDFFYRGIETDCDGYPVVIDDPKFREALTWYVIMKLLGRGFKHQVFTYADAEARWKKTYPQAQNRCRAMDIDGYQQFKLSWTGLTAGAVDPSTKFFTSTEFQKLTSIAKAPGSLG